MIRIATIQAADELSCRQEAHVVETILRSPEALANLLEAAGSLALERAGAILDQRFPSSAE